MLKQIMIPVAAFAVTATAASAFNTDMLEKIDVDLTTSQIEVLEEVHELRQDGADRETIKTLLEESGLDQEKMKGIHDALREVNSAQREVVNAALESNDYDAFIAAIADSPLAESITSEADFEKFAEARELMEAGDREGAKEIMDELGIEKPEGHGRGHKGGGGNGMRDGFGGPGHGDRQSAE